MVSSLSTLDLTLCGFLGFCLLVIVILVLLLVRQRSQAADRAFFLQITLSLINQLGREHLPLILALAFAFLGLFSCQNLSATMGEAVCWVLLSVVVVVFLSIVFLVLRSGHRPVQRGSRRAAERNG
ncbi:MAG TPA: hypothetical protein VLX44_02235 [Xanthobacteraceae bacterium]|nr:hypothetical protein [Xanthobacteraceae bacterium]